MSAANNMIDSHADEVDRESLVGAANEPHAALPEQAANKKRAKRDVHGWLVLDKPVGMTSTHAVAVIKRLFAAKRAGHAGTLDPLASGCLPIALGEATKTVPFVVDGRKTYHLHGALGRGARHRRCRGPRRDYEREPPRPRRPSRRCCRASPAPSSRCRRASPPSRSKASGPTISPARARRSSCGRAR